MFVRIDEHVGRMIYYFGSYDQEESRWMERRIRATDVCVDIGANVGYYTLLFAGCASQGAIHSFEPVPLNYHLVAANVLINRLDNVTINRSAVADVVGETEFVVSRDSAYSSLHDTGANPALQKLTVSVDTLDHYCEERRIYRIDVLKADVEGAEGTVLDGCRMLLEDPMRRPRLIVLELVDSLLAVYGSTGKQVITRLARYGYHPFLVKNGILNPFDWANYAQSGNVFFMSAPE